MEDDKPFSRAHKWFNRLKELNDRTGGTTVAETEILLMVKDDEATGAVDSWEHLFKDFEQEYGRRLNRPGTGVGSYTFADKSTLMLDISESGQISMGFDETEWAATPN